jgi:exo-beta-1,3-glucanase (GH17 family)
LSNSVVCSINGVQLVSDYTYYPGTNTVTVSVTDANQKSAQTTINVIVTIPQVTYRVFGIDYSPYVGAQNPNDGTVIDDDQLTQQIGAIAPYTTAIRSFGCTSGLQDMATIAKRFGLTVYVGVWIGPDPTANNTELQNCITVAQTVPVDAVIIGSEALLRNDVTPAQLIMYINQFRASVPGIPISTADQYLPLENNPAVVAVCDFVFANFYPFWEGTDISTAVASLNAEDALLRATYAPKVVVVSETGWQSFGNPVGNAVPSAVNAAFYFLNFESWAQAGRRKTFYFEDHDEPWKGTDDGWGIWDENQVMESGMIDVFNGVTIADNWTCNAVPGGSGSPMLQFTTVPPIGSSNPLQGQEWHAVPACYYIVVYIHVGSYGWWVKPYAASPLTTIGCDGSWTTNIDTGGSDASADQIAAFLIPTTYNPPALLGAGSLPSELYTNSVANAAVTRQ